MSYMELFKKHKADLGLPPETLLEHQAELDRQLGSLATCILRSHWNRSNEGYKSEALLAIADATCQLAIICELFGLDFEEAIRVGRQHLEEKLRESRKIYEETGEWY